MGRGASKPACSVEAPPLLYAVPVSGDAVGTLRIADVAVTGDSFPDLARLQLLRRLHLRRVQYLRDGAAIAGRVAQAVSLEALFVAGEFAWEAFFDALSSTTSLVEFRAASPLPLARLVACDMCRQLKVLRVSFADLTCADLRTLVAALEPNRTLTELNVSSNELENEALIILRPLYNRIRRIDLGSNNLQDSGDILTPLLTSGGPLVRLRIGSNTLLGPTSFELLTDRLPLIGLRELRLADIRLAGLSDKCLASMTAHLDRLDLGGSHLGDAGIVALATAFNAACSLTWLNLARNKFSSIGMEALSAPLATNRTLLYLNLSFNRLDQCGVAIASVVAQNATLRKLSLKGCFFTLHDWGCIASSIASNSSLRELVMYANRADRDLSVSYGAFARALVTNRRLTVLKIQREDEPSHFQDPVAAEKIIAVLEKNYVIIDIQGCSEDARLQAILRRNQILWKKVQVASRLLLLARKFDRACGLAALPSQVVVMIAKHLLDTRGDLEWL